MKSFLIFICLAPIALILIILGVLNRQYVQLSIDPLTPQTPFYYIELPFFVFILIALITGILLGGLLVWVKQGVYRKKARLKAKEALKWQREAERQRDKAEALLKTPTHNLMLEEAS